MKVDVKKVAKQIKSQKLKDRAKKFFQDMGSVAYPAFPSEKVFLMQMEKLGAGRRLMI